MTLKRYSGNPELQQSLHRLAGTELIVSIWREDIDPQAITGYVVDLSPDFVVIHNRSDYIVLDGYSILRVRDITGVDDKPKRGSFWMEALKLRGQKPRRPVGVCLDNTASILESVNKHYSLLAVHREGIRNDECAIGRIEKLTKKTVILQWLNPSAQWDGYSPRYRLTDITKIDFGGLYEDALALVARILPDESGCYGMGLNSAPLAAAPPPSE